MPEHAKQYRRCSRFSDSRARLIELCYARGWTDGLPVVPPIQEFVDEFLAFTQRNPDEILMAQERLDRTCNIRQAAINAVMAGCRPEYFPVLLAMMDAFESGGTARTNLMQSTTGQAEFVIVNGPVRNTTHWTSTAPATSSVPATVPM